MLKRRGAKTGHAALFLALPSRARGARAASLPHVSDGVLGTRFLRPQSKVVRFRHQEDLPARLGSEGVECAFRNAAAQALRALWNLFGRSDLVVSRAHSTFSERSSQFPDFEMHLGCCSFLFLPSSIWLQRSSACRVTRRSAEDCGMNEWTDSRTRREGVLWWRVCSFLELVKKRI